MKHNQSGMNPGRSGWACVTRYVPEGSRLVKSQVGVQSADNIEQRFVGGRLVGNTARVFGIQHLSRDQMAVMSHLKPVRSSNRCILALVGGQPLAAPFSRSPSSLTDSGC